MELRRIDMLHRNIVPCSIALVANSIAFCYVSWEVDAHSLLIPLLIAFLSTVAVRLFLLARWKQLSSAITTIKQLRATEMVMASTLAVSGLCWGVVGWISLANGLLFQQLLAGLLILGTASGGAAIYAPSLVSVAALIIPGMLVWGWGMLSIHQTNYDVLAVLGLMYTFVILYLSRQINTYANESLKLAHELHAKQLTEQAREQEHKLFLASREAKLKFLANASHEIRTPLSAIVGYTEALLERPMVEAMRTDLRTIQRNGKYLVSVVNDLLDLSKSETQRLLLQIAPMSPVREINDALLVVQSACKRKDVDLKLAFDTEMPEIIFSDSTRFRQILINLLSNAIKFTPHGGVKVTASCLADGTTSQFRLLVQDTGLGIDEPTSKNLFEPFVRGQNVSVQRLPGSGLGLALSRNLSRHLGGDLRLVKTKLGYGSTFELTVDAGDLSSVKWQPGESRLEPEIELNRGMDDLPEHGLLAGKRVLLVEDDPDLSELMQRLLERYGAQVQCSDNGASAIDSAMKNAYDVVLMDIKMPIMDGYQATSCLREKGYRNPIFALTAHASSDDQQLCYQSGFDCYLSKPVDQKLLIDLISRRLDSNPVEEASRF